MGNHGDDCYFFYYSTCTKGDNCPFRHCTAALGNEIVCNLWQEGHCFRTSCKFRHMEITKNRKEIPCYWESQAAGCQKPHCAFLHERPRTIEGIFFPADKSQSLRAEQPHEEQSAGSAAASAALLPTAAAAAASAAAMTSSVSPQLRNVIKPEATEPVPSPTHPPVVINAADDDEDEDEEGETGPSPRKITSSDDSLNFGVSTLEEIRLRKALKASMKRAGYTSHSADDVTHRQNGPLRKSLADRLGRTVFEEQSLPLQPSKPVKDRLGLFTASAINAQAAEINTDSKKAPEQIRIKTLEEIRKEKAAKSQTNQSPSALESGDDKPATDLRQVIVATHPVSKTKSTRDAPRKEPEAPAKAKLLVKRTVQSEPSTLAAAPHVGGIQVKTLEEIRREKAARMEAQRGKRAEVRKSSDGESCSGKSPRLLLVKKAASPSSVTAEKSSKVSVKSPSVQAAAPTTSTANGVKVKTFEEIMQEKRLRRQELGELARGSPEAALQKDPAQEKSKRKVPAGVSRTLGSSSPPLPPTTTQTPPLPPTTTQTPPPTTAVSTGKLPTRKLISLKSKAALVGNGETCAAATSAGGGAAALLPANQSSSRQQQTDAPSQAKRARTLPPGGAADVPVADKTPRDNQEKVSSQVKVRPKLNVKPSVVKPEFHVKPGQKRKAAECSAVAAVKPLNSGATGREVLLQTTSLTCRSRQALPSSSAEDGLGSTGPSQSSISDSSVGVSKAEEELKTSSNVPETKDTRSAARGTTALGQSPQLTSIQPRSRRASSQAAANTASSAVDDFDKLIMEFTDDENMLDDNVDNDVNEDDLLQELSEMIEIDG